MRIPRHCQISQLKWDLSDFLLLMLAAVRTLKFNICPSSNRLNMSSDIPGGALNQNIPVKLCSTLLDVRSLNRMVNVSTQPAEPRQEAVLPPLV